MKFYIANIDTLAAVPNSNTNAGWRDKYGNITSLRDDVRNNNVLMHEEILVNLGINPEKDENYTEVDNTSKENLRDLGFIDSTDAREGLR